MMALSGRSTRSRKAVMCTTIRLLGYRAWKPCVYFAMWRGSASSQVHMRMRSGASWEVGCVVGGGSYSKVEAPIRVNPFRAEGTGFIVFCEKRNWRTWRVESEY